MLPGVPRVDPSANPPETASGICSPASSVVASVSKLSLYLAPASSMMSLVVIQGAIDRRDQGLRRPRGSGSKIQGQEHLNVLEARRRHLCAWGIAPPMHSLVLETVESTLGWALSQQFPLAKRSYEGPR